MIQSMTAYGSAEDSGDWGQATCEIRSVNHRYLEVIIHLPVALRMLEQPVRENIAKRLKRGKVDCTIRFEGYSASTDDLSVDEALLNKLIAIAETTNSRLKKGSIINVLDLLSWPGVLDRNIPNSEEIRGQLLKLVDQALNAGVKTRKREGEKIKVMIIERCELIKENLAKVREFLPAILYNQREKLRQRTQEIGVDLAPDRLEQELLILSQKMDIAEELDRLDAHIHEVQRVLNQEAAPVGRRLDFLMQEMNRESNTLGAKSMHLDTTNVAVELKVLIEQMREQVQNIE